MALSSAMQPAGNIGAITITLKNGSAKKPRSSCSRLTAMSDDDDEYGVFAFVDPVLLLNEAQCSERLSLTQRPMITPMMVRAASAQLIAVVTEAPLAQHEAESADEAL